MALLEKHYQVMANAPKELDWEEYTMIAYEKFKNLLADSDDEKVFQNFFEQNPSFMPGGLELIGHSGHYPYMHTLISQPEIGIVVSRKPDFLWLAQNSLEFSPVFIEIEKPTKKMYTSAGIPNAEFNQALNQIDEWRILLNDADNIRAFYRAFSIPSQLQQKRFNPQFLLVYGRRTEYEGNEHLTKVRAAKQRNNVLIMSYDRMHPISDYKQFTTCNVVQGKYKILHIPPTYRYRADTADVLANYENFVASIDGMEYTTIERKEFLKERYSYWTDNPMYIQSGLMKSQEGE